MSARRMTEEPGGMEAMEATLITEVAETFVAETQEDLIKELSNFDLMLVGGGIANVHFCLIERTFAHESQ